MKRKLWACIALMICILSTAYADAGKASKSFYVDAVKGNDANSGTSANKPWRSFNPINKRTLSAGTKVFINPGNYHSSLIITGKGTSASPINITLQKGAYHFYPDSAFAAKWHISNTNDAPDEPKHVAIYIKKASHVAVKSAGADVILHGKMIETMVDHSDHVTLSGLTYDYNRPTISELTVTNVTEKYADLKIEPTSTYSIADSILWWEGEDWRYKADWYWQVFNPATGIVERQSFDFSHVRFVDMGNRVVRAFYPKNVGFKTGMIYQTRDVRRDCAGIFLQYSQAVTLQNIQIYYMHGMGVVSQFCKDITINSLAVKPKEGTERTCAAWADILHFSGCSGKIEVANSYLSGANDDAINIHGTHLKIVDKPDARHLKVRFMHNQSYGFDAFFPGDSIALVHAESLLPFGVNRITKIERLNDREVLLTLKNSLNDLPTGDNVVENTTRTPSVWIHHNTITRIPTRGILLTTRRHAVIEHNKFRRVNWNAIVIADDAESWFESGPVKDVSIRDNDFWECGGPVICIVPENRKNDGPVHQNVTVNHNTFTLRPGSKAFAAKSATNLQFISNDTKGQAAVKVTEFADCRNVTVKD